MVVGLVLVYWHLDMTALNPVALNLNDTDAACVHLDYFRDVIALPTCSDLIPD